MRADAVAIGPNVADDTNPAARTNGVEDTVNDFSVRFQKQLMVDRGRSFPAINYQLASRSTRVSLFTFRGGGFFEFVDDFKHAIAAHD